MLARRLYLSDVSIGNWTPVARRLTLLSEAARTRGIELEGVKPPDAKRGFGLRPCPWVAERSFTWAIRFRRSAKDDERYDSTFTDLHLIAFACPMLRQSVQLAPSPQHLSVRAPPSTPHQAERA